MCSCPIIVNWPTGHGVHMWVFYLLWYLYFNIIWLIKFVKFFTFLYTTTGVFPFCVLVLCPNRAVLSDPQLVYTELPRVNHSSCFWRPIAIHQTIRHPTVLEMNGIIPTDHWWWAIWPLMCSSDWWFPIRCGIFSLIIVSQKLVAVDDDDDEYKISVKVI